MERFLSIKDVLELMPFSRATLYRLVDKGHFPAPCKIGGHSVWPEAEITAYIAAIKKARPRFIALPLKGDEHEDLI